MSADATLMRWRAEKDAAFRVAGQSHLTVMLDFNYAYNPYCAYNAAWTCPILPPENTLTAPVRAVERAFQA